MGDPALAATSNIESTAARLEDLASGRKQNVEHWMGQRAQLSPSEAANLENLGRLVSMGPEGHTLVLSAEQLARGLAAVELGKFSELGKGSALTASSNAGAKFYEGGPYKGEALDPGRLKENMIVQEGIEQVMGAVGGAGGPVDWSSMWPYGVFTCSYDFEEKPLD